MKQINDSTLQINTSLYCPLPLLHPSSFPLQSPSSPPRWVVLADYQATESGMLTVYEGELVEVIDISRNEWCLVRPIARGAAEGWVPATYLKPYDAGGYSKSVYPKASYFSWNKQTCIFGCTCMYIEDCKGWWLSSGCSSVFRTLPAQAQNPGFIKETNLLKYIFDGTQVKNWLSLNI